MKILFRNVIFTMKNAFLPFLVNVLIHGSFGLLPVLAAYLWKKLIEFIQQYINDGEVSTGNVILYVLLFSSTYGLSVALPVSFEVIDTLLRNSIKKVAQTKIHDKMEKIPYFRFEDATINDYIVNSSQTMVNGIFMYFSLNITYFVSDIISLIASMLLLFSYSKELLLVYPILIIPVLGYAKHLGQSKKTKLELTSLQRKMSGYEEYITDLQYVKDTRMLNCSDYFLEKRRRLLKTMEEKEIFSEKKVMLFRVLMSLLSALSYGTVLAIGIYLMSDGKIQIAEYASLISLVGVISRIYNKVLEEIKNIPAEKIEIEAGFKLLDMPEGNYDESEISLDHDLSLENVSFRYPLSDRDSVADINLKARRGQIIAIVGENGAGKSTLVKLMLGLYEPSCGTVRYDGKSIANVSRNKLFSLSSAVFEDYNKYALNIDENIALSETINTEKLYKVTTFTGADKVIMKFDDKEKTFLGKKYGGADISGGEWQKIALSRGYYKNSSLIILDEPTASLDPITEFTMYKQFREMCNDKIGIIITHRLPAASIANYIYYINNGKITEEGTHLSLIEKNGEYAKIYMSQKELFA